MNLYPNEREMLGLSMNRDFAGYPNNQYSPMDQMMMQGQYPSMNYPNMMMPNYNSYPGQYQGVAKTNACGCTSTCGMPCMWW